jgi:UDP-galactopyranose mutase
VFLRFQWNDWSQGANLHPDEYGLANTLTQLSFPRSLRECFNTRLSPLSPYQKYDANGEVVAPGPDYRMRWGQLPITIFRFAAEKAGLAGYGELVRLGRRISALADCLTLLILFLIGRRLYNRRIALLATAFSALAVMQIQQSHLMTVDTVAALFAVVAMYCAVRAAQEGRAGAASRSPTSSRDEGWVRGSAEDWKWYALFGVAAGMAVASRINLILLLGVIPFSAVIAASEEGQKHSAERSRICTGAALRVVLAAIVALVVFRVAQPMAIRAATSETTFFTTHPNPDWVESMKLAAAESNLEAGGPPAEQWTGRTRLVFPLINMVLRGMGLPLGLAACAGLVWALWRFFYGGDWRTHLPPLIWTVGYLLFMGTRHVMSLRYLLPIYPFLALLAAWALTELHRKFEAPAQVAVATAPTGKLLPRPRHIAAMSAAAVVVLGTLVWALAFTTVYRHPNTRIEASRWIYANVAAGATLANESCDESLPVPLDGRNPFGGSYRGLTMEVRWSDGEAKRKILLDNLSGSDYIILSSQRALWSISRLPNTYPMTMVYYRALFDGRLGFDVAAQFQRPFRIGPLHFSDLVGKLAWRQDPAVPVSNTEPFNGGLLGAEEAFSVYDHAPVWIFRKRPDFSLEEARDILQAVDLGGVVAQGPREASSAPTLLMLPSERLAEQRAGGTWSSMFNPGDLLNRHHMVGVVAWYGTLVLMGWLAFPLTFVVLGGLPDRGYPLAKTLALLLVAWVVWIMGSFRLLPFARATIVLAILMLTIVSCLIFRLRRIALMDYLHRNLRYVLTVEVLFAALFLSDLMIRLGNPDLWHPFFGGEKPMVFSYFNAVLKSTSFPPYDPWLAGGYINYYYYGLVVVGQLVKLLGWPAQAGEAEPMKCDYLVVGAGFFGSVLAERLANDRGADVLVIDKRSHIGGNCHSQEDPETGIEFHTYGTHVFHTSSREVWNYITRFTEFNGYRHQVLTVHKGRVYQMPINLATISAFFNRKLSPAEARELVQSETRAAGIERPENLEEKAISAVGRSLYEAFICGYTTKQWNMNPRELPPEIIERLPVRYNYDNNYFSEGRWQGIPLRGYTKLFEQLLHSPRIKVNLDCDFFKHRDDFRVKYKTIYTGPIDRYFEYIYGRLEWRSVEFAREIRAEEDFQGTAVMNYADLEVPYTRIHEPRHLHPERSYRGDRTLIICEKSGQDPDEPYYPVKTPGDQSLLAKYVELARRERNVIIGGRLGGYAYSDMDKTILAALRCYRDAFP